MLRNLSLDVSLHHYHLCLKRWSVKPGWHSREGHVWGLGSSGVDVNHGSPSTARVSGPISDECYRHKLWQAQLRVQQPSESPAKMSSKRVMLLIIPTFLCQFASVTAAEGRCKSAAMERVNHWSYGQKMNAQSAAGTIAFSKVRQLLEAAGWRSPDNSHPPLSPDWDWCGDIMLCLPSPAFLLVPACHRELLCVSRFCLDPLPFLLPHISKCTCTKINGGLKTKSTVCFGMLLIHLFGSSYCSSGLPWSSLSAHPAALICSLNFCCGYIRITVNSQGCCLDAFNPLSQWESLY